MTYVSINPGTTAPGQEAKREFAALIHVQSSRYVRLDYNPDSDIAPKIAIGWSMGTTKGNTFERKWSTGIPWDENLISKDGKKISVAIKKNSDAMYFLQKVVNEAGFPSSLVTDDVSVFDGHAFFMATDKNPNSQGSSRKEYPKKFHPEGWEVAKAEVLRRRAEREAQNAAQNSEPITPSSSYSPPPIVVQPDVAAAASGVLKEVITNAGGSISRMDILKEINKLDTVKSWPKSLREQVTASLWERPTLTLIAAENGMKVSGDTVSFG